MPESRAEVGRMNGEVGRKNTRRGGEQTLSVQEGSGLRVPSVFALLHSTFSPGLQSLFKIFELVKERSKKFVPRPRLTLRKLVYFSFYLLASLEGGCGGFCMTHLCFPNLTLLSA